MPMIGLMPCVPARLVEVEDAVHVAVVGDADRRLAVGHRGGHDLVDPRRAVEHRELGVEVEVGERVAPLVPRRPPSVLCPRLHLWIRPQGACGRVTEL